MAHPANTREDFWRQVQRTDGCWPFTGYIGQNGYGRIRISGREWAAHVFAYVDQVGPVPDGLVLDHVCHSNDEACAGGDTCPHRRCVNPAHLEPVTALENFARGRNSKRLQTECINGHPFTDENTYIKPNGTRMCRPCRAASVARHRERNRTK